MGGFTALQLAWFSQFWTLSMQDGSRSLSSGFWTTLSTPTWIWRVIWLCRSTRERVCSPQCPPDRLTEELTAPLTTTCTVGHRRHSGAQRGLEVHSGRDLFQTRCTAST